MYWYIRTGIYAYTYWYIHLYILVYTYWYIRTGIYVLVYTYWYIRIGHIRSAIFKSKMVLRLDIDFQHAQRS
jgi:hypothetical protein